MEPIGICAKDGIVWISQEGKFTKDGLSKFHKGGSVGFQGLHNFTRGFHNYTISQMGGERKINTSEGKGKLTTQLHESGAFMDCTVWGFTEEQMAQLHRLHSVEIHEWHTEYYMI